jgi:hypothetical protein
MVRTPGRNGLTPAPGLVAALPLFSVACDGPHQVEGVVLLDGSPLEGVTVDFRPEDEQGPEAIAVTGPDGRFQLSTSAGTGAMPNRYRVVLTKVTGPAGERPPWVGRSTPPNQGEVAAYARRQEEARRQQKQWVPTAYTSKETTPLPVVVPVTGKLVWELREETGTK